MQGENALAKVLACLFKILCLPVTSADNLGKQFGPRSGPTEHWA